MDFAQQKRQKYGAVKTTVMGITFASKREAARYQQLLLMQRAGLITDLQRQVPFEIASAQRINGRSHCARKYIADFVYGDEEGNRVVEDAKGVRTETYRLKRHLMAERHGIHILET